MVENTLNNTKAKLQRLCLPILIKLFELPTCPVFTLFGELNAKTATCEHLVLLGN
jgi:hypothetical protein